jgi:protein-glutamine gamma-glutamyltransferase
VRRRARPRSAPEDSIALRIVVAAIVMVAVGAVVAQGAVDALTAVGAVALPPVGFAFSHVQRHRSSWAVKVILAVALLCAFAAFLQSVRLAGSVDQARGSLASLFLWVQILHAFDVPRRRDLAFSVAASVTLVAEAGALSLDTRFLLFLVPWAILAAAWLYLTNRPRPEALTPVEVGHLGTATSGGRTAPARSLGVAGVVAVVATLAVFLMMPRLPGAVVVSPPFSLRAALPVPNFEGQVVNPGMAAAGASGVSDFTPSAYPGFGGRLDLRARGSLSDRLVMRVRAPQAALWRGEAYDTYDGTGWTASDERTRSTLDGDGAATIPPPPQPSGAPSARMVQTFYVQSRQPNVVFGAYRPSEVYFPAGGLRVDSSDSVRAPILLDPGMIYSVVSDVPDASPALLRAAPRSWPRDVLTRDTQLPASLPRRVGELARTIVAGQATEYDEVMAVQRWLREHTRYNLDIPPDPPGVDPIDEFLFVRRQGFCEHIATSMALLLREVGIPTRLVTGFGPGERNPLTGYFDVRERDAHAWVEVLYPGVGWVPYDPTFGVPPAAGGGTRFLLAEVLGALGRAASRAIPDSVKRGVGEAASALATGAHAAGRSPATVAVTAFLLAAGLLLVRHRRRRDGSGRQPTGAALAYVHLAQALRERGVERRRSQTPSELLAELPAELLAEQLPAVGGRSGVPERERADAELIVRTFEAERYARTPPDAGRVQASLDAAERLAVSWREARPGRRTRFRSAARRRRRPSRR